MIQWPLPGATGRGPWEPLVIVPDGPDEDQIPQLTADRKARLVALAEWAKAYSH